MTLILTTSGCAAEAPPKPAATPATVEVQLQMGQGVFLSANRIAVLKERVAKREEPTYAAFLELQKTADLALERNPTPSETWYVPLYYKDAEGHLKAKQSLQSDANNAYALALMHRLTGEDKYASAVVRNLNAWVQTVKKTSKKDDSTLSFSYHFPAFILAADLIKASPVWAPERQTAFKKFVREKALPLNTMSRHNNWGNWGLVLVMASAAYLEDEKLFNSGVARWKVLIETQIAADGHLPHEVIRNAGRGERGISYSNFTLWPQSIAAEIARVNGVKLYDYKSPSGRTLRLAYERLTPWVLDQSTFPYYKGTSKPQKTSQSSASYLEMLNTRWPNEAAAATIAKWRPMSDGTVAPFITFTHGSLPADL